MKYKRYNFQHKETITTVFAEDPELFIVAADAMMEAREEIENYIKNDPYLLSTLTPYHCEGKLIGEMSRASLLAGVGPMASVAGCIAGYAVDRMVERGASFAVVDNGGDIAMSIDEPIIVGVYTGHESSMAFRIEPKSGIRAVCTSSGRIGHSFSFGDADAATVFGEDPCTADAFATALGNEIGDFGKEEIKKTLRNFWEGNKDHVIACTVVRDDVIGLAGKVPEMVAADMDMDLISKGNPFIMRR